MAVAEGILSIFTNESCLLSGWDGAVFSLISQLSLKMFERLTSSIGGTGRKSEAQRIR